MPGANVAETAAEAGRRWETAPVSLGPERGPGPAIGMIALASDRVGVRDVERFLAPVDGVEIFVSRVPIAPVVTPSSLAAMQDHLANAAALLVPGSHLDAMAFSCTSGAVAIGLENVRAAIGRARPGVAVRTPIDAGLNALRAVGASRIALLTPYLPQTSDLVSGFFEDRGVTVLSRTTFGLDGDLEMNRVTPQCLIDAAKRSIADTPGAEALFISCTGLFTSSVVEGIETATGLPVITSNQALAWDLLRTCGDNSKLRGRGRLFL